MKHPVAVLGFVMPHDRITEIYEISERNCLRRLLELPTS